MKVSAPPLSRLFASTLPAIAAALALVARPANAEIVGVFSTLSSPGSIYSISATTGAGTLLTTTPGSHASQTGAEFRQGVLYATDVSINSNPNEIYFGRYDLTTGAFTPIVNQVAATPFGILQGLAYRPSNDLFYATNTSTGGGFSLVTIQPTTGAITFVGNLNRMITGLAFDQANDILYGLDYDFVGISGLRLVRINPSTAAVTVIGLTGTAGGGGGEQAGLAFDEDNRTLYMNNGALWRVNTTTGAATLVGNNNIPHSGGELIDGLAWRSSGVAAAAPEPGTLALFALAVLPLVGAVVRRRAA